MPDGDGDAASEAPFLTAIAEGGLEYDGSGELSAHNRTLRRDCGRFSHLPGKVNLCLLFWRHKLDFPGSLSLGRNSPSSRETLQTFVRSFLQKYFEI